MNGCDPNCCCDVDCSASDKESFTECSETKNVMYVVMHYAALLQFLVLFFLCRM